MLIWLMAGRTQTTAQVATTFDYDRRLGAAEARLRRIAETPPTRGETIGELRLLQEELPATELVESERVRRTVRNEWLDREIRALIAETNGDVEQQRSKILELADRIGRLRAALPGMAGRLDASNRESAQSDHGRLGAILARPEYQSEEVRESSARRWWHRLRELIGGLLRRLLPASPDLSAIPSNGPSDGRLSLTRIFILFVMGIIGLYGVSRIWRQFRRSPRTNGMERDRELPGEMIESDVAAPDLLARAKRLADQGEYRTAIRLAYISTLLHLADDDRLRIQSTKTNRDYLEELQLNSALYPSFSRLTVLYEDFWYGEKPATSDDFELFTRQANELTLDRTNEQPLHNIL